MDVPDIQFAGKQKLSKKELRMDKFTLAVVVYGTALFSACIGVALLGGGVGGFFLMLGFGLLPAVIITLVELIEP